MLRVRTDAGTVDANRSEDAIDVKLSAAQAEFVMGEGELVDVYGRLALDRDEMLESR